MELSQIILIITLLAVIIFLGIIGSQLYITLTEFRKTLNRVNGIIDNAESFGGHVEHGFREFLGFFGGFRTMLTFVEKIANRFTDRRES